MNPRQIYFPILVTFIVLLACARQEPFQDGEGKGESIQALIDKALSPAFSTDGPGAVLISAVDGEIVFRKGYGLANLEQGVPLEPDMVFRVASITKEFTAVLVMQLVEQGVISLEDEITDFPPDYPVQGHSVTLRHILSHTSGIKDFHDLPAFQNHLREDHTLEQTLAIFKNEPFDFSPGERFSYTSSGYLVLGAILEQVTGKTYEQLLREKIFDVIGMRSARLASHDDIIPKRVNGYTRREGILYNSPISSMTIAYSGGGLMMSADDLAVWDEALYGNELLNEQSKETMWSPGTLNSGRTRFEIFPESETSFFFQEDFHTVTFEFDDERAVTRLLFTLDTGDQIRADKVHSHTNE
jgi:CubicO group peptidase (beta-lactamase class C family)